MPEPQSRTEYRVVGTWPTVTWPVSFKRGPLGLEAARHHARYQQDTGALNVRIQKRTVTEHPWEDVQKGEGDD